MEERQEQGSARGVQTDDRFRLLVEGIRDYVIFMLDPSGHIATWNIGAERIKGYKAAEVIGRHFSLFYTPEEADTLPDHELVVAGGPVGRFEGEGWRVRKNGSRFWANVVITAVRDESGQLIGFAKVTRDLTDGRRKEEELRRSEERFRLMVEAVRDHAIFMLDPEGRVVSWNTGAQRIKGFTADDIIGQHFSRFYPQEAVDRHWPQHELAMAKAQGSFEDEGWRVRKDGTLFWANVVITAIHDEQGILRGFAKVTRDLTEKRRVAELEAGERQVNEFLAMLAHELRNPLAPIRNALGVLQVGGAAPERVSWARDIIGRQVGHMTRLVDDLLDLSRVISGKIALHLETTDVAEILSRAVESVRPLTDARGHTLHVTLPDQPMRLDADVTRLAQVFVNLLNNAAKYTPEGGRIEVSARPDEETVVVRLRDNGIGIVPELLPRIFDLFTQGERTLDRSEGGLGLGLALVRRLVRMHGGTVEAASGGAGRGTEFTVRLPLSLRSEGATPAAEPAKTAATTARRVMVVDDNDDSAESMCLLLELWGHQPKLARNGPEALALAAEYGPELVLLDIGLPGMDGYEVARRLAEMPQTAGSVLVAMTGYGQEEDRRKSRDAGFAHHLVKPVPPVKLQEVIAALPG